jgi:hypothetical protein
MNREVHARFFQRIADLQGPVTFGGQFRFVSKGAVVFT